MTICLFLLALVADADGTASLPGPLPCQSVDSQLFQYDDGTAYWLTWGGLWRGNWFTMDDFGAYGNTLVCDYSEFWFYHHSCYCWDTDFFFAEIWSDNGGSPQDLLSQESVTAAHYTAVYCDYSPPMDLGNSFWVLDNTEMSSGGWPPILGDDSPQIFESHSFFTDDFTLWDPWVIEGPLSNSYLIRVHGAYLGLEEMTWAGIKAQFQR